MAQQPVLWHYYCEENTHIGVIGRRGSTLLEEYRLMKQASMRAIPPTKPLRAPDSTCIHMPSTSSIYSPGKIEDWSCLGDFPFRPKLGPFPNVPVRRSVQETPLGVPDSVQREAHSTACCRSAALFAASSMAMRSCARSSNRAMPFASSDALCS